MLSWFVGSLVPLFFFFNDTATTEIYTLSLHDALPIYPLRGVAPPRDVADLRSRMLELRSEEGDPVPGPFHGGFLDRKSTRLNSSHANISYAVFCLKKKKTKMISRLALHHMQHDGAYLH